MSFDDEIVEIPKHRVNAGSCVLLPSTPLLAYTYLLDVIFCRKKCYAEKTKKMKPSIEEPRGNAGVAFDFCHKKKRLLFFPPAVHSMCGIRPKILPQRKCVYF